MYRISFCLCGFFLLQTCFEPFSDPGVYEPHEERYSDPEYDINYFIQIAAGVAVKYIRFIQIEVEVLKMARILGNKCKYSLKDEESK